MNEIAKPTMKTIKETAEFFNLPVYFVRSKVNSGEVVSVRAGKKFLVNIEMFSRFLNGEYKSTPALNAPADRTNGQAAKITPIPRNLGK